MDAAANNSRRFNGIVSIRARHAMHRNKFQSAPGTSAGRYITAIMLARGSTAFQSAPGTSAGRYPKPPQRARGAISFQSAPGTSAGRYTPPVVCLLPILNVSIRARHECRAIQRSSNTLTSCHSPFQSAPGTSAGRYYAANTGERPSACVSIRARHECRAIPRWPKRMNRRRIFII